MDPITITTLLGTSTVAKGLAVSFLMVAPSASDYDLEHRAELFDDSMVYSVAACAEAAHALNSKGEDYYFCDTQIALNEFGEF